MESSYLRGAFIAYEPDGSPFEKRIIPFRFNPESLSRQLSLEQGESGKGAAAGGGSGTADPNQEQSADAASGNLKESFNVLVRFDAADRQGIVSELSKNLPIELGVAPEIAALEDLLYPAEAESDQNSDGSEPTEAKARRPTVLFVWGKKRVYPVRITAMTVDETLYNRDLFPLRAEIDVSLEVLSEADAKDNLIVQGALEFTHASRRAMAKLFLATAAEQGSQILPL